MVGQESCVLLSQAGLELGNWVLRKHLPHGYGSGYMFTMHVIIAAYANVSDFGKTGPCPLFLVQTSIYT